VLGQEFGEDPLLILVRAVRCAVVSHRASSRGDARPVGRRPILCLLHATGIARDVSSVNRLRASPTTRA
jgi:hypothetical protein